MEVRIGIRNVARELVLESRDDARTVEETIETALGRGGSLRLEDDKGRTYVVPVDALGFVQIGDGEKGRVGFGVS